MRTSWNKVTAHTAYHHAGNGICEHFNIALMNQYDRTSSEDWKKHLGFMIPAHNARHHDLRSWSASFKNVLLQLWLWCQMLLRPRVRFSKVIYIIAEYCINIIIDLLWKIQHLLASPQSHCVHSFKLYWHSLTSRWTLLTKLATKSLITRQIQKFMLIQKQTWRAYNELCDDRKLNLCVLPFLGHTVPRNPSW